MLICPNAINSDRCGRPDCPMCGAPRYQDGEAGGVPNFVVHPDLARAMGWEDGQVADVPVMVHEGHVVKRPARIVVDQKIPATPGMPSIEEFNEAIRKGQQEVEALLERFQGRASAKAPPPPPGTAIQASDRMYQVGLAGEYRRVTPKPPSKKRRKESR